MMATLIYILAIVATSVDILWGSSTSKHTGIILLGGTGDLARKYLWQAFFDAYLNREETEDVHPDEERVQWMFTLITGGASHASVAANRLKDIFDNNIICTERHKSLSVCTSKKGEFFDKITYFQLQTPEDYGAMCESLQHAFQLDKSGSVKEVLLYLAIPPGVFHQALKLFHMQCSFSVQNASLKVILEKPQGIDLASAANLSAELLDMFEEDELYRTDHYLAKSVVTNILPFRAANPQLEKLLNKDHVERVEIFLKESIGVEDRYSFYNEMGVIRDVFQNHLTQLLTLVTIDLPVNMALRPSTIEQAKVRVLMQVTPAKPTTTLLGQYSMYTYEAAREISDTNITALVPTFAAALLKVRSPRWADVPFVLVSGKKLDERSTYIRIIFKDTDVCVSNCDGQINAQGKSGADSKKQSLEQSSEHQQRHHHQYRLAKSVKKQIVFQIVHGPSKVPLISVSKSLGEPELPESLQGVYDSDLFHREHSYHGDHPDNFFHATPVDSVEAYSTLIEDVLHGRRHNFVSTNQLLLAWQIWDGVIDFYPSRKPRIYDSRDPASVLNFAVKGDSLEFVATDEGQDKEIFGNVHPHHHLHQSQTPATFLGHRLVSGSKEDLAFQLAQEIEKAAGSEISSKGVFHVAFSGGETPVLLWQMLAQSFAGEYWAHVHVWQVDERCVLTTADTHSNLFQLDRHLLRFVAVPWSHVHAMPVDVAGRLCDPELQGDRQYADSIRHFVGNLQLDFVVLGVGSDGHTASLFPHSPVLSADFDTLVSLTDQGPADTPRRMTMTLPLINRAKRIAVMATGQKKQEILQKLEESGAGGLGIVDKYPILGVNPGNGTLTWFVDYEAYFERKYSAFANEVD